MVNRQEAQRIASAITMLRGDWSQGLIMAVLGDERCIHRSYADLAIAMTAVAVDPQSKKPGRIHEPGPWWGATLAVQPPPKVRAPLPDDCDICSQPVGTIHNARTDHEYRPRSSRPQSALPTDEQRAALEAARIEAEKAWTAERKPEPPREVRDPAEVIAKHVEPEENV